MYFKPKPARSTLAALAFTAFATLPGLAIAQGTPPPGSTAPPVGSQSAISTDERTVQAFAVAFAAVQDVQIEYIEKIKATKEPGVSAQLQNEAQSKMISTVQAKGLSVDQYNSLAQKMQSDPGFRQRVEQAMQK